MYGNLVSQAECDNTKLSKLGNLIHFKATRRQDVEEEAFVAKVPSSGQLSGTHSQCCVTHFVATFRRTNYSSRGCRSSPGHRPEIGLSKGYSEVSVDHGCETRFSGTEPKFEQAICLTRVRGFGSVSLPCGPILVLGRAESRARSLLAVRHRDGDFK